MEADGLIASVYKVDRLSRSLLTLPPDDILERHQVSPVATQH
jgi:hypothetical protein